MEPPPNSIQYELKGVDQRLSALDEALGMLVEHLRPVMDGGIERIAESMTARNEQAHPANRSEVRKSIHAIQERLDTLSALAIELRHATNL